MNADDRVKLVIGSLVIQVEMAAARIAQLEDKIKELEAKPASRDGE